MRSPDLHVFQSFLDNAVARRILPGVQCCIFNKEGLIFNGTSGFSTFPSENNPEGELMKPETPLWIASCSKIAASLIVLHIIEKGLTKSGFSLEDLDNHDALTEVLPEFKHGSGSMVTKILDGLGEEHGPDGKRIMKLKDASVPITLRMLLTHTAGMPYRWNHPLMSELYTPSDGSPPTFAFINGSSLRQLDVPLVIEPNTTFSYGTSADWVGLFAVRSSGKNLQQLLKEILFEPLDISPFEADIWTSPTMPENRGSVHVREQSGGFQTAMFPEEYNSGETPPVGKTYNAGGAKIRASCQAYSKLLSAILNHDKRILSEGVWQLATQNDLRDRGIKIPRPVWSGATQNISCDIDVYAQSTVDDGAGVNLLQCNVATAPVSLDTFQISFQGTRAHFQKTISGRSAGSFAWAGLFNLYFFVDPSKGIGAIFGTQLLPFYEPRVIEMRDEFERLVYATLLSG